MSSSSTVYTDDGTEECIASLSLKDPPDDHQPSSQQSTAVERKYKAYVVFAGLRPGIYDTWCADDSLQANLTHLLSHRALTKPQVWEVPGNNHKGYRSRLQAERTWVLANALGTTRVLDRQGLAYAIPANTIPELVVDVLGQLPDAHIDTAWYVVTRGRTPGVFPAW